ncbi:hypothetical protein GMDG_00491 [Pseudogymnoascus destructans 20631-21]|uniref:endo-1,4-beta-xylanase n=1 Tax=Pseudogymnoascus destructans (strain ATCC MYA-4855 / 20631-21) TaxID=658429 RepID=L8G5L7_PSED2|nr:hypothetical protein GMDG_00491 [Pseudogymnoascus destructans 20631-21]
MFPLASRRFIRQQPGYSAPAYLPCIYRYFLIDEVDNDLLAAKAGKKYFGTATDNGELNNKDYTKILNNNKQFGQPTPSNGQKWMYIEPEQKMSSTSQTEKFLAQQLPEWVSSGPVALTQWKGKCYAWDVVNEAFNDDGTFRETVFYNVIGEDYFALAFETAAEGRPSRSDKTRAVQKPVRSLKKQNVRIDGVGAQAHLIVGSTPSLEAQIQNLQDFGATGVEVAQTELDIC